MKYDIMSQSAKLLQQYKKNKRWLAVFLCLAVTVVLGTLAALKLYGQAMTHKMKVLECIYEVHEHTEECYDEEKPEELICVYADYVVHMHNDDCYNAKGELVCPLEEVEPHEHTEECYEEVKTLICELETAEGQETETESAEGRSPETEDAGAQTGEAQSPEGENAAQNNEAAQEPVKGDLICTQEEHAHGEACYSQTLTCTSQEHTHTEACMDEEGNLTCTLEEHTHGENCYGTELTCTLAEHAHEDACWQWIIPEEVKEPASEAPAEEAAPTEEQPAEEPEEEAHVHTDECYVTEKVLKCGKLELHTHTDECYGEESFDEEGKLIEGSLPICGLLQLEEHTHTEECFKVVELTPEEVEALENGATLHIHEDSCYDEEGNLICGQDATHILVPECYDDAGKVICGFGKGAHVHEESCYDGEGNLICGYETASHPHTESCYDAEGNLQCGYETATHVHEESCYDEEGKVICGYAAASHVHSRECYDENGELICGYETAKHVHEESCYGAEGNLICGYNADGVAASALYCDEQIHRHEESCYDGEGNLICGKAEFAVHTHGDDCYNADGKRICPLPEIEVHVHSAECYPEGTAEGEAEPACGKEEVQLHTHTEECYDESGALICGKLEILEHAHSEACKVSGLPLTRTFQGESFIITAVYKQDANIPAEAELIAEQITEESDSEHYAQRQEEYQEVLGDNKATMRALLKIGFYVKDENGAFTKEVEPESPVTLTIQFLDENGLAEGKPVTVIHFADEGAEVLEGSEVQDGSTTFEMSSFSEIAIGDNAENLNVPIDEAIDYDTDTFHITFHIKGYVTVPIEESVVGTSSALGEINEQPEDDSALVNGNDEDDAEEETPNSSSDEEQHITGIMEGDVFIASVKSKFLDKDFEFRVETLDESAEEYAAVVAYGEEIGDDGEELLLQVWAYTLNYDGQEVDLSDCEVIAEIIPTQELMDAAKAAAEVMAIGEGEAQSYGTENTFGEDQGEPYEYVFSFMGMSSATGIDDIETAIIGGNSEAEEIEPVFVKANGFLGARASGQPNPPFTVQYYANLEKVAYNDDLLKVNIDDKNTNELPVIDTEGKKLPKNGKGTTNSPNDNNIRNLYVDTQTGKLKTKSELTKVYETRSFEYHKAPTINYINAVIENPSYELKEVWILKKNKNADSIESADWVIYPYNKDTLHFTNRELSQGVEEGHTYIFIAEDAVIRLVYDTTTKEKTIEAAFYDYDIGNGKIYATETDAKAGSNSKETSSQGSGTWYMKTNQQGINNPGNYPKNVSGAKLAFGNANTGSGLQHEQWNENLLNKHNGTQDGHPGVTGSYKGCTFGLVTGLKNGKIQYASGVVAPNLFNDGEANGKTAYDTGYSLQFNRVGDTHTLIAVNNTGAVGLDSFNHPSPYGGKVHNHIWTNNFWPMDSAGSFGTNNHDMKFGSYADRERYKFAGQAGKGPYSGNNGNSAGANGIFPWSDDGKDHNSYFGMHYKVQFELVADYVGPLEYYFFGDDDMWVFLGDENSNSGKLVCDIGGVHSSVGEYLNLWDYIDKEEEKIHRHTDACYGNGKDKDPTCGYVDSKKFTLNFFYTERGESGSTCWMQFTLPSVSSLTPETTDDDFGHLEIRKTVKVTENGKEYSPQELFEGKEQQKFFDEKEFEFTLKLQGPNGKNLKDDYAYIRYDKMGNPITDGSGVLQWETIADGETFKLKDGEYIRIQFLPVGTTYTLIEESNTKIEGVLYSGTEVTVDSNSTTNGLEVSGTIPKNDTSEVSYINKYSTYKLPETGGPGTIIYTMAGVIVLLGGAGFLYKRKFRERRV